MFTPSPTHFSSCSHDSSRDVPSPVWPFKIMNGLDHHAPYFMPELVPLSHHISPLRGLLPPIPCKSSISEWTFVKLCKVDVKAYSVNVHVFRTTSDLFIYKKKNKSRGRGVGTCKRSCFSSDISYSTALYH